MLVDGSFDDLIYRSYPDRFLRAVGKRIGDIAECLAYIDCLSIPRVLDICAAVLNGCKPFFLAFLPGIAFDNEGYVIIPVTFFHEEPDILGGIIAGTHIRDNHVGHG